MHSMLLILDANFILLPVQFGIDIYDLLPLTVPDYSADCITRVDEYKKMEMEPTDQNQVDAIRAQFILH